MISNNSGHRLKIDQRDLEKILQVRINSDLSFELINFKALVIFLLGLKVSMMILLRCVVHTFA